MNKKTLQELKQKLENEKAFLIKNLEVIAKKDPRLEGDWDTKIPSFDSGQIEEEASELEEYISRLPVEYSLELKLTDVNGALEKIKKNRYGICEKCKKPIKIQRLKVCPEAKFCTKCSE